LIEFEEEEYIPAKKGGISITSVLGWLTLLGVVGAALIG